MKSEGAVRIRYRRSLARAVAGAGVALVAVLSWSGVASAHTVFEGSDPGDGAALAVAPPVVSLDFSETVSATLAKVKLTDGAGHNLPLSAPTVDARRQTRLQVWLPKLPPETYRLSFSIRDTVDLHETAASVVFGVATVPNLTAVRPATRGPDPVEVALRGLARGGLAVLLGALVIMLVVLPRAFTRVEVLCRLQRAMLGLALLGAVVATAGDTAVLGLQAAQIGPLAPTFSRLVSESAFGRRWLIGLQITVGLILLLSWLRRQMAQGNPLRWFGQSARRRRPTLPQLGAVFAGVMAMAEAVAVGMSGHSEAADGPTATGVALRAAHLLAAGTWVGGLIALGVVLYTVRRLPDALSGSAARDRPALLRRFSTVAAAGLAAVVVTGLLLSGTQVATVTALLTTWYGIILLVKVVLLGGVALVGLHHARLIRSSGTDRSLHKGLRRTLPLEAAGGLVVLLLGAALGATAPARGPQFNGHRPPTSPSAITIPSGDLLLGISLKPNRPGRNLLAVDVFNTRRPAPAAIEKVVVTLWSTSGAPATVATAPQGGDSHWDGGAVNLAGGDIVIDVSVERAGRAPSDASVPWSVNSTEVWRQPTVLSAAPLAPLATGAAVAVMLVALASFALSRRRARPQSVHSAPKWSMEPGELTNQRIVDMPANLEEAGASEPALS